MEKTLIDWNSLTLTGQVASGLHRQEYLSEEIKKISDVIDKSIVDNNKKKQKRKYLGGSSLGEECSRKIQYRFMGINPDKEKEFNAKTLRIFQFGHEIEDMKAEWIKQSGFDLRTVDKQGEQFGFSIADDQIKGHIDGVICGGPVELNYPMLWECKSANDKKFKEFTRVGVTKANPTYAAQIAVYQAYMDLHENPALFTVMNKNTCEIYYELVPFDKELAQRISDKGVNILIATKASDMLPRIAHNKEYFTCKWCEFNKTCWND
tara:strand:- start:847 stop:1638 length:792 start_codon:yes stop_codon:yes gene_type:complete